MQKVGRAQMKEFISDNGEVFLVVVQSNFRPKLKNILGTYESDFQNHAVTSKIGPQRFAPIELKLRTDHLVVHVLGVRSRYFLRAYDPRRVPTNVDAEALQ